MKTSCAGTLRVGTWLQWKSGETVVVRSLLRKTSSHVFQCVTRSLFQFSRQEREFLSFNLMFETRMRISFSQSRASRRERELICSISGFETRTRIEIKTILTRIFGNYIYCLFIDCYFQKRAVNFSKFLKMICLFSQEI